MKPDLHKLCDEVITLVKTTGAFMAKEQAQIDKHKVNYKGPNDLVTYVDTEAEKQLVEGLQRLMPESGFITEEGTVREKQAEYQWIIDPLDGTMNYVNHLSCYSISVALSYDSRIVLGVVYEVGLDECFYAIKDTQAQLNGEDIHVSEVSNLRHALLGTGFPYQHTDLLPQYLRLFRYFLEHTHGLRRLGSAAVDLCYVACGRFEGFYEYNLNAWDVAAGAFIVQQAGGKVTDFKGGDDYLFGKQIVAGCPGIFEPFQAQVGKHM